MDEKYYNALNLIYKGSYARLKRTWAKFNNWQKAWQKENSSIDLEKEWDKLEKLGIKLILQNNPNYPAILKEIFDPPFGLYILGNLDYKKPAVAIVGTRNATPQGKELAAQFAEELASAGITIISGMALGIDAMAHQGALKSGGKTIAVLGTSLDNLYPKQNLSIAEKILKNNGAIISEFPLNHEYIPQNFLIRNRIISGLSDGILIIEAPEKSGSLATAKFALEQNREIFVIPGNIQLQNYRGSNSLIKAGANLITEPKEILEYFNLEKSIGSGIDQSDPNIEELINIFKNKKQKFSIDQLAEILKTPAPILNKNLAILTIKGIIKESNGKYFLA